MMNERDVERLLNLARTELVGASDAGIKGQLYDVCREFFKDSNSWYEHIKLPIIAGQRHIYTAQKFYYNPSSCLWVPRTFIAPGYWRALDPDKNGVELRSERSRPCILYVFIVTLEDLAGNPIDES